MIGRFQNRSDWNDTLYRCYSQSQFNYHDQVPHHGYHDQVPHHGYHDQVPRHGYHDHVPHHGYHDQVPHHGYHDQVPHHGWDSHYAGGTYVPRQTARPTIPAEEPLHQPQPVAYCKICEVKVGTYKNVEAHNNGKRHRRMLNLHEELQRQRVLNGQGPKSQMNLAVQSKTFMKSGENRRPEKFASSEATIAKHKNCLQKDIRVTSEIPAEGKLRDNAGTHGHSFKHKIGEAKTGKYLKTNDGVRRPMKSSKLDNNSLSDSAITPRPAVTSHIVAPTPVVGSSFKPPYQHVSASQRQVLLGKKYHENQKPTVETNAQSHVPADSSINSQPEDVSYDSAVRAIRPPKAAYCKICEVQLPTGQYKMEMHYNGQRHQRMLKVHEELQRLKTSNQKIQNSQKNLEHETVQIPGKNAHLLKNMSSEAYLSKHKNYWKKDMGQMSEVLARGSERKLRDNSGAQDCDLKHKIIGAKTGKYIQTNDGVKRPMESSKFNINSPSKSIESPVQNSTPALAPLPVPVASHIMVPTHGVGSSFELEFQHVSASQSHVSEDKEHVVIQNPTAELTDQPHVCADSQDMSFDPTAETKDQPQSISVEPHAPAGSDICTQTEEVTSDSAGMDIGPASLVSIPPTAVESSFEPQIQHALHIEKEPQLSKETADSESQNCTDENNNQLLPSVGVEFNYCSGSCTNFQTADECSKVEQKMDVFTNQTGTTLLSQVAVCLKCGDVGFPETRVFCNKCQVYAVHRYCLDGPVIFINDVTWFCEDCEPKVVDTSFHDPCTLLASGENVSPNLAKDAYEARMEPKNCIERVKNKQNQQNIPIKTKVLLSDNHSLSQHGLSKCSNNNEKEKKFEKECQPVSSDETTSEGSMIVTVPQPIADPVWRGSLRLSDPSFDTVIGLLAHLSTLACSKALEETKLFPDVLYPDVLQRSAVWPKSFMTCGPNEESIALYFFPDTESVERAFDKLVDDMICFDLAIRAVVENAELLVFSSTLLPIQCRRFQEKYYLWGVFRAKKTTHNTNDAVCREVTTH